MSPLTQGLHAILATTTFFAMVYLTYIFTYLAPTRDLRRWGATTSWLLIQFGPARPVEVIRIDGMAELRPPANPGDWGSRCGHLGMPVQAG